MSYYTQTPADPAASADALRHRHILSYQHASVSGFYTPETGQYGATRGTCRDCGQRIVQVCAEGDTLASNRRAYIAEADLEAAYAENTERAELAAPEAPEAPEAPAEAPKPRPWQAGLTSRQVARVMKATNATRDMSRADYNAALRAKAAELYPTKAV